MKEESAQKMDKDMSKEHRGQPEKVLIAKAEMT